MTPPAPAETEAETVQPGTPGYELIFTDKDLAVLPKLSLYELQHALYAAWKAYGARGRDPNGTARAKVLAIYAEYTRRGWRHYVRQEI